MILAIIMVVNLVIVFIIIVVFVIAHCLKRHNISQHGTTAAEALISSSAVVQEGSPKHQGCYLFSRVKNR